MATAREELAMAARGEGCLGKAAPDEPVFVLRGQDAFGAELVDLWALRAERVGCPSAKVQEARDLADRMRAWPVRKNPD